MMLIVSKGIQGRGVGAKAPRPDEGKPATSHVGTRAKALTISKAGQDRAQRFEKVG